MDRLKEKLQRLFAARLHFILEQQRNRFGLLIKNLQNAGFIDVLLQLPFILSHALLQRIWHWLLFSTAFQQRTSIKQTTNFSTISVTLHLGLAYSSDFFVVELVPRVSKQQAELIMAEHWGGSFVNHHSPKNISLAILLFHNFCQSIFQLPNLSLHHLRTFLQCLQLFLEVL